MGVWGDARGDVFISEYTGNAVKKVTLDTGLITVTAGNIVRKSVSGTTILSTVSTGSLSVPRSIFVDTSNKFLYFAENQGWKVRRVSPGGIVFAVAGIGSTTGSGGDGGRATAAGISGLRQMNGDTHSKLYITASATQQVRMINLNTAIITLVAGSGLASPVGVVLSGPATSTSLNNPVGVDCDLVGNVYIAEYNANAVKKLSSDGYLTTIIGTGVSTSLGDGGPPTAATLMRPYGLFLDPNGNLYISEVDGNHIRKLGNSEPTTIITTIAGNGTASSLGNGGKATSASINGPRGVWSDSAGNVYIAEWYGNMVRKVTAGTNIITKMSGTYSGARSIFGDTTNKIYVAATNTNKIVELDATLNTVRVFAGAGGEQLTGDGGPASSANIQTPDGLWKDSSGWLYVSQVTTNILRKISPSGIIYAFAGTGDTASNGLNGDGGTATSARFSGPRQIYGDSVLKLYIAEASQNRVRILDLTTLIIKTFVGTGYVGGSGLLQVGPISSSLVNNPCGVTGDSRGNIYVSEYSGCRVKKISDGIVSRFVRSTSNSTSTGDGGPPIAATVTNPYNLFADSAGNVFITEAGGHVIHGMSSAGRASLQSIFCAYKVNSAYNGPILQLKRSTDSATASFYSDSAGNLQSSEVV
eukprot:gene32920-40637_t